MEMAAQVEWRVIRICMLGHFNGLNGRWLDAQAQRAELVF
jgi:hypothetical protein